MGHLVADRCGPIGLSRAKERRANRLSPFNASPTVISLYEQLRQNEITVLDKQVLNMILHRIEVNK